MPFSHQLTARRVRLAKYSPMGGCAEGLLCCRHLLAVKAGGPDGDYTWFISPPARCSPPSSSSQVWKFQIHTFFIPRNFRLKASMTVSWKF
jgi:hypothetical protein